MQRGSRVFVKKNLCYLKFFILSIKLIKKFKALNILLFLTVIYTKRSYCLNIFLFSIYLKYTGS